MTVSINIVYFAWVKERLGKGQEQIDLPPGVSTIHDLLKYLSDFSCEYQEVFSDVSKLRFARDHDFVTMTDSIEGAEELAIFPPVTGG